MDVDVAMSGTKLPDGEVDEEGRRPSVEDQAWVSDDGIVTEASLKAFVDVAEASALKIPEEQRALRVSTLFEYCSANCNPFGERENALMATTTMLSQKGDVAGTRVPLSQVVGWCRRAADPAAGTHFPPPPPPGPIYVLRELGLRVWQFGSLGFGFGVRRLGLRFGARGVRLGVRG